jgi:hypothetical protein
MVGLFALFLAGALVRALRKGTISSRGVAYSASEGPKMFAFVALSQIAAIVFFGWLAAGGDNVAIWHLISPQWASIKHP